VGFTSLAQSRSCDVVAWEGAGLECYQVLLQRAMARLLPHEGYVFVEEERTMGSGAAGSQPSSSKWFLHHVGTRERKQLPNPQPARVRGLRNAWSVKYDDEGYAVVESESGEELDIDDVLTMALYEGVEPPKPLYISDRESRKQVAWEDRLLAHRHGVARVQVGSAGGTVEVHMSCFDVPRKNGVSRCFFSLLDIHDALGLGRWRSGCGRGRWVLRRHEHWGNLMMGLAVPGTFQKSMPVQLKQPVALHVETSDEESQMADAGGAGDGQVLLPTIESVADETRVLPYPAADTVAYLTFVATSAYGTRHLGGVKKPEPFREKLDGLLRCLHGQPWKMSLWIASDVEFRWPAAPAGQYPTSISVSAMGKVDWRHNLVGDIRNMPLLDHKVMLSALPPDGAQHETLTSFVRRLIETRHVLLTQVLWRIGQRLDAAFAAALASAIPGAAQDAAREVAKLHCTVVLPSEVDIQTRADVMRKIIAYWHLGRQASRGQKSMSLAYDKSRIFGMSMGNGAFVLRDGTAWWGPPQVLVAGTNAAPEGVLWVWDLRHNCFVWVWDLRHDSLDPKPVLVKNWFK